MRRALVAALLGGSLPLAFLACGGTSIEYRYRCSDCDAACADAGDAASAETDAPIADAAPDVAEAIDATLLDAGPVTWRAAAPLEATPVALRVGNDVTAPKPFYVATDTKGIFTSNDRGASWSSISATLPNLHLVAMGLSEGNANSVWAVADRAFGSTYVFHTTDRGGEWRPLHMEKPSGRVFDFTSMFLQPGAGQFFGGKDPSTNAAVVVTGFGAGDYWTPHAVADATGTVRSITALTSTRVYAAVTGGNGGTGGVYRSYNAGDAWEAANEGIDPIQTKYVSTVVGDPSDPLVIYAGVDANGVVYKSIDGADTWALANDGIPPEAAVLALVVRTGATNEVYAGTTIGAFRTLDAGAHWHRYGLEGQRVTALAIDPSVAGSPLLVAAVTAPTPGVFVHDP